MTHLQSVTLGIFLPKKATIILLLSVTYLKLQIIKKNIGIRQYGEQVSVTKLHFSFLRVIGRMHWKGSDLGTKTD